ncbi:ribonuclease H-like domain-containing protein [Tanacetum coccineum]
MATNSEWRLWEYDRMTGQSIVFLLIIVDFKEFKGGYVAFGNDSKGGRISGKGTIKTSCIDFEKVSYVEELKFNLLSVSQICDKKHNVLFTDKECLILSPKFKFVDEDLVILRAPRKNDVYSLDLKNIIPSGGITCLVAKATKDEAVLWHRRLGHGGGGFLQKKDEERNQSEKLLEFVDMDLLDCFSREMSNIDMLLDWTRGKGIKREYSIERTPQQNGVAERKNRTLIEAARTMLADSLLLCQFWMKQSTLLSCYVLNRVLGDLNLQMKDPYEILMGKISNIIEEGYLLGVFLLTAEVLESITGITRKNKLYMMACEFDASRIFVNSIMMLKGLLLTKEKERDFDDDISKDGVFSTNSFDADNTDTEEGGLADYYNMDTTTVVTSTTIVLRIHKIHPQRALLCPLYTQTNRILTLKISRPVTVCCFLSQEGNPLKSLMLCSNGKRVIGTKWVFRNKRDEWGTIIKNKARLVAQGYRQEEGVDYDECVLHQLPRIEAIRLFCICIFHGLHGFEDPSHPNKVYRVVKALYGLHQANEAWFTVDVISFLGDQPSLLWSMIGCLMYLTASRPDIMFAVCLCARFQVTPKVSHLHAVKRIFSDYAGDNHDRRSTSGGCQYLGRRLVSWQCKKQTIVAISSTEAEYVAAASCCAQGSLEALSANLRGDCFTKQVIWEVLGEIGYEGNLAQLTFSTLYSATVEGLLNYEVLLDFQGSSAEPHNAANIPKSPNDYTPTDASQTSGGNEGLLDLYALNREVRRLKKQTLSQAKLIRKLKTKLKNLSQVVAPVVKHHAFWVESQHLKKQKRRRKKQKKKVSSVKLGRNKEEGTLSEEHYVQDDYTAGHFFEDIVDKMMLLLLTLVLLLQGPYNLEDEGRYFKPIRSNSNVEPCKNSLRCEVLADISRPKRLWRIQMMRRLLARFKLNEMQKKKEKRVGELKKVKPKDYFEETYTLAKERNQMMNFLKELQVIDSPDGEYLIIHRANNHFRAFDTLWEILHILDRQDLYHLYRVVQDYYEHIPPRRFRFDILGVLITIWETPETMMMTLKDQEGLGKS